MNYSNGFGLKPNQLLPALIITALLFMNTSSFCQIRNTKNHYSNGRLSAKGKILICPGFNEKYPCYDSTCRKIGKWIYYYQNGNIKRIENYEKIKHCSFDEVPSGNWKFFNEHGSLIKQDEYKNGILWTSDLAEFCENEQPAGVIQVRNGTGDTIFFSEPEDSNLIVNGDFNLYIGKPIPQEGDGQAEIGKQIPFWLSTDNITPDYYNQFRRLKNVPDNLEHVPDEMYSYTGIILYHDPTKYYTESITGEIRSKLKPDQNYCLKIRIRLSGNSGFYTDILDVYFSDTITNSGVLDPQICFNHKIKNRDAWATLCALYSATGNERFVMLGRLGSSDDCVITPIAPLNSSACDFNQSAYYLIDKIELHENTSDCNCTFKAAQGDFTF